MVNKQIFTGDVSLIFVVVSYQNSCDVHYAAFTKESLLTMAVFRSIAGNLRSTAAVSNEDSLCVVDSEKCVNKIKITLK